MNTVKLLVYLNKVAKRDNYSSDLAKDILRDTNFPLTESYKKIKRYLKSKLSSYRNYSIENRRFIYRLKKYEHTQ